MNVMTLEVGDRYPLLHHSFIHLHAHLLQNFKLGVVNSRNWLVVCRVFYTGSYLFWLFIKGEDIVRYCPILSDTPSLGGAPIWVTEHGGVGLFLLKPWAPEVIVSLKLNISIRCNIQLEFHSDVCVYRRGYTFNFNWQSGVLTALSHPY